MTDAVQLLNQQFAATQDTWVQIASALKENPACLNDDEFRTECPATKFILTWMKRLGEFQTKFGNLFGRVKRPPKADEFTAAVALCLEQFLAARGLVGTVASEETTHRARGAKRPDISVCSLSGQHVATVECKTNFGWNRKKWKEQIDKRTKQLHASCPGSDFFLCILTRSNWDYSEFECSPNCGKTWFCLSTVPVGRISDPVDDSDILRPIEPMFLDILAKVRVGLVEGLAEQIRQMSPDEREEVRRLIEERSSKA